jgi:type II secretory pathway pseudopilin PulG
MKFLERFHHRLTAQRPGVTLIEMLLFVVIMALMAGAILPFLFAVTESRQRQDAIALVEQNGAQVMQSIIQQVRSAERILDPAPGGTGFILALQTDSGATNPTIIARDSGSIVLVRGHSRRILSSDLVGVTHFAVDNTSSSEDHPSIAVSLDLRRIIRLHQPLVYESHFDTVINLYPDDEVTGGECNCVNPYCDTASGSYVWQVCIDNLCVPYSDFQCVFED